MVEFDDFGKRTAACLGKGLDAEVIVGAQVKAAHVILSVTIDGDAVVEFVGSDAIVDVVAVGSLDGS